jgi:exodeoxyribonuclease VII small subunit
MVLLSPHSFFKKKMAKKKSNTARSGKSQGKQDDESDLDFESSLAEVEQIVARLEGGELGLAESLQQYETGIKQLKHCHALLDAAQQRVSLLSGFDADGNPLTAPLQDLEADAAGDKKRRSKGSASATNAREGGDDALNGGTLRPDSVDDFPGLF